MTDSNNITPADLRKKIEAVMRDLQALQSSGDIGRKFEVLSEYKEYLEDELRELQRTAK